MMFKNSIRGVASAIAACLVLAGCGGSDGADRAGGTQKITLGVGVASAAWAPAYIAQSEGFYEKHGVDVTIEENTGSNTLNSLVSGRIDIGAYGGTLPLLASLQGKQTTTLISTAAGGGAATLVGGKGITDIKQLDGKRVAVLPAGSSSYGWAQYYQKKFGVSFDLVAMQDGASIASSVISGNVDGAMGIYTTFAGAIGDKKVNLLLDTRDMDERQDLLGARVTVPEGSLFGLASTVKDKREAVEGVLAAWNEARVFLLEYAESDPEKIAQILSSYDGFSGIKVEQLAADVRGTASYNDVPDGGHISESDWQVALDTYATWGISGFDKSDDKLAYGNAVDMSFLDASNEN